MVCSDWSKNMTDIFLFSTTSQQLTSLPTTELLQTFYMSHSDFFEGDVFVTVSQK